MHSLTHSIALCLQQMEQCKRVAHLSPCLRRAAEMYVPGTLLLQVLQSTGEMQSALSCSDMVVSIWASCLSRSVLRLQEDGQPLPPGAPTELPVGRLQLVEVVEMLQVRSDVTCSSG
eukprot:GHRQ01004839.1.p4 GENE.GHRQ01004839.1~~GHRQ01004839.1.p4  ORF type:complete len:117 (-),score=53.80 GHRQ01004839.1:1203-1553(-)